MATTDLTNTRWLINDIPRYDSYAEAMGDTDYAYAAIVFYTGYTKGNNNTYNTFSMSSDMGGPTMAMITYENQSAMVGVYDVNRTPHWYQGDDKKIITITSGRDVTSTNFIAWLEANATEIKSDIHLTYGSVETDEWSPLTLNTSGQLMSNSLTIEVTASTLPINNRPTVTVAPSSSTQTVTYDNTIYTGIEGVIVNGVVPSFTNAATASSNNSGIRVTVAGTTYNISTVTVPSGKTLTVTNTGTTNINGGNTNRGVQVTDKLAIVDGYTVTDNNGDLLTPTYNSTTKALTYPAAYTVAGTTAQYTLSGEVTSINGALVRDTTAVSGSGTASSSYSNTYLAKWNSATTLSTGPHITISTSTPGSSSGVAGDIWYQVL